MKIAWFEKLPDPSSPIQSKSIFWILAPILLFVFFVLYTLPFRLLYGILCWAFGSSAMWVLIAISLAALVLGLVGAFATTVWLRRMYKKNFVEG